MTEYKIECAYRGHAIHVRVRSTKQGMWTWSYSIDTVDYRECCDRPQSSYDDMLNAAMDEGRRRIDAFEDGLRGEGTGKFSSD